MVKREKNNEKRTALLKATLSLVNNNGFHDAPMSKIAKLTGVSPATIYLYFDSKQDLINQLYVEVKASFCECAFNEYDESLPIKKGFEIIWKNIAHYKFKNIEEAVFLSQCDNTPMIDETSKEEGLKHLQPLIDLWERGKTEKIIKPISSYLLYAYTIYPLAFLMNMQKKDKNQLDENCLENAFQAAWDSIRI
ncbi:TetR/AcrR family transcriptional regulator [Lutibacter sp. B1]|uniref:TetR/AcrR family transcriptional regulator n=1 Tax=Lutibacter sp. B1 TaxID=2725996 RepID=UPI001456D417|nr:TetR/AcrR family transcriptional regulator [Lutibacter sp. B1]NLP57283.1 TetR/AcrR family transcriptional regulator [Lutibacter sp. B1]